MAKTCWACDAPQKDDAQDGDRCPACYVPQYFGDAPKIRNLGQAWPWPAANDPRTWFESCREHYWTQLEVLPPIYFPGGFFVSEPYMHDGRGVAIYAAWVCVGSEGDCSDSSRYFVRHVARDGHAKALAELYAALGVKRAEERRKAVQASK